MTKVDFLKHHSKIFPTDVRLVSFLVGQASTIKPAYNGPTKVRNFCAASTLL